MAHVKCEYTQYKCGNIVYGFTGEGCENQYHCDGCSWLDPQPGFIETTSKKVSWDGETLMIGNRFYAVNEYDLPYANETIIESLEIDGQRYDL